MSDPADPRKLTFRFPTQGWRQFLTARTEMLDAFDRARAKSKSQKIETYHGKVAEGEFRRWLISFLPKKFGVTSGYIVSPGRGEAEKTPHFDVIIYDQLESPILWIDDNPDSSGQGRSMAIPVEYVRSILEVKSRFSPATVKEAIDHLADLLPLTAGQDGPDDRYRLHLASSFVCGTVFFDLHKENEFSEAALDKMIDGLIVRGFWGGIILRGEGHPKALTGRICLTHSATQSGVPVSSNRKSLLKMGLAPSVKVSEHLHFGAMLTWSESAFAQFAFDLVAMLNGEYRAGFMSSFHGLGRSDAGEQNET